MEVVLAAIHAYQSPQAIPLANAFLKAYLTIDEGLSGKISVIPNPSANRLTASHDCTATAHFTFE